MSRGIGVEGGLEAQPHWAPVQCPAPHWQGCRGLHWGPAGCVGHQRASRGVGVSGGIWVAVGLEAQTHWAQVQGPSTPIGRVVGGSGVLGGWQGVYGCQGALGWKVDWKPYHIGPKSRVPALPLAGV